MSAQRHSWNAWRLHMALRAGRDVRPGADALRLENGEAITYEELEARASRVAAGLRARGAESGDRVAIDIERGFNAVVAYLGCSAAGLIGVPIDASNPLPYRADLVRRSQARLILSDSAGEVGRGLAAPEKGLWAVEELAHGADDSTRDQQDAWARDTKLATLMFTSGSTGTPKCVRTPHSAFRQRLDFLRVAAASGAGEDLHACLAGPAIPRFIGQLAWALERGDLTLLPTAGAEKDAATVLDLLRARRMTTVMLGASLLRMLLVFGKGLREAPSLRHLLVSGEAFPPALQRDVVASTGAEVLQCYGSAEANLITLQRCDGKATADVVGAPCLSAVYILDEDGRQGVDVGEIWASNHGLADGYDGDPEATQSAFRPNPFHHEGDASGPMMCRLGDVGSYAEGNNIVLFGRRDHQVKVRGYRVNMLEIERALLDHPAVHNGAVVEGRRIADSTVLIAFASVSKPGPSADDLKQYLSGRLPMQMVPSIIELLDVIPSRNGKVDRTTLSERAKLAAPRAGSEILAASPEEACVRETWETVLGCAVQSPDATFFELGGHSLAAARMLAALEQRMGVRVPYPVFIGNPTPAGLASELKNRGADVARASRSLAVNPQTPARLTPVQLAFYLLNRKKQSSMFNVRERFVFNGAIDDAILETALSHTVAQHQALRACVARDDEGELVLVEGGAPIVLERLDATRLSDEALDETLADYAVRRFDLRQGPLCRVLLVERAPTQHALLFVADHIICDGWSVQLVLAGLLSTYAALSAGRKAPQASDNLGFLDFLRVRSELISPERVARSRNYWLGQFARGVEPVDLLRGAPRPAELSTRGASLFRPMGPLIVERLEQQARRLQTTPYCWLLAAFQVLLARRTGASAPLVCTPLAGREANVIDHTVGMFMNPVLIRVPVASAEPFAELVAKVHATVADAAEHQHYPSLQLAVECPELGDATRLHAIFFAYHGFDNTVGLDPVQRGAESGLDLVRVPLAMGTRRNELTFDIVARRGALQVELRYATDLFEEPFIARLAEDFAAIVEATLTDPTCAVQELGHTV